MIQRYATPLAFKQALEQRLKSSSTAATDELIWRTLTEVAEAVSCFLYPLLGYSSESRI
jgi:hypothetical protein